MQACLCLLLLLRRYYREFPVFFALTGFSIVQTIVGLAASSNTELYRIVYWASDAVGVFLTFFSLQEAFRSVFRNFLGMRWFRWLFPGIGFLMISIAVLRTILVPRPAHSLFTTTIFALEIGVGFLQFGIFSLFLLLVRIFHLRWRQHPIGIVFGFGISAAGSLVAFLLRSEFGTKFDPVVRIAPPIAYIIAVAVWLATFLRGESSLPAKSWDSALTPEQMITELRRHTKAVKGILGR
jgi:hypothetical protein